MFRSEITSYLDVMKGFRVYINFFSSPLLCVFFFLLTDVYLMMADVDSRNVW